MNNSKIQKSLTSTPSNSLTPKIESNDLFIGAREIIIVHQDIEYRLRITRHGKLILTK